MGMNKAAWREIWLSSCVDLALVLTTWQASVKTALICKCFPCNTRLDKLFILIIMWPKQTQMWKKKKSTFCFFKILFFMESFKKVSDLMCASWLGSHRLQQKWNCLSAKFFLLFEVWKRREAWGKGWKVSKIPQPKYCSQNEQQDLNLSQPVHA